MTDKIEKKGNLCSAVQWRGQQRLCPWQGLLLQ